jgi:hypothetical protein
VSNVLKSGNRLSNIRRAPNSKTGNRFGDEEICSIRPVDLVQESDCRSLRCRYRSAAASASAIATE